MHETLYHFHEPKDEDEAKVLADLLNVKPREIKSFLSGHLVPGRTQELQTELLAAGIPL